jgi:hypothetical protein
MEAKPLQGPLEGVGPENRYMAIGLNDFKGTNPLLGPLEGWALVMDLPASKTTGTVH